MHTVFALDGKEAISTRFNFMHMYNDVLSIQNPNFEIYLDQLYTVELEIKNTTESNTFASYLDLFLSLGRDGQLHTSINDKRDDLNFHIASFKFLNSNIQLRPSKAFLSHGLCYMPATVPHINVLFGREGDFPIAFSNRDMSKKA